MVWWRATATSRTIERIPAVALADGFELVVLPSAFGRSMSLRGRGHPIVYNIRRSPRSPNRAAMTSSDAVSLMWYPQGDHAGQGFVTIVDFSHF